jgi:hypothetical protein
MVVTARTAGLLGRSIGWLTDQRQARWAARLAVVIIVVTATVGASVLLFSASWRDRLGYGPTLGREDELLILVKLPVQAVAALIALGRVGDLKPWPRYGFYGVGAWVFCVWFFLSGFLAVDVLVVARVLTLTEAALFLFVAGSPDPRTAPSASAS